MQSASLELDQDAEVISYEEYHPYGTTAYQAKNGEINVVAKRYRYTGKERDEESGLYYHGARYYVPWLCRWCACDPLESKYGGMSPYNYSFNNPVMYNDPSGADPDDKKKKADPTSQFRSKLMPPVQPVGDIGPPKRKFPESTSNKETPAQNHSHKKVTPAPEKSVGQSFLSGFVKGVVAGIIIAAAAAAVIAFTGGLAGPLVAAVVADILVDVGVILTAASAIPVVTGKDYSGNKLTSAQRAEMGGELLGNVVGGGLGAKRISGGKSSSEPAPKVERPSNGNSDQGSETLDVPRMEDALPARSSRRMIEVDSEGNERYTTAGEIANDVLLQEIENSKMLGSKERNDISTIVGGANVKTGQRGFAMKIRGMGKGLCAEDILVTNLEGRPEDIVFSRAYRPRTGEFIDVCDVCQTKYSTVQFVEGTKFKGK